MPSVITLSLIIPPLSVRCRFRCCRPTLFSAATMPSATAACCHSFAGEQVFDSDDGGANDGDEDGGGGGGGDGMLYDKFGNVVDKAAVERAALQEAREAARAARAAKVGGKGTAIGTALGTSRRTVIGTAVGTAILITGIG